MGKAVRITVLTSEKVGDAFSSCFSEFFNLYFMSVSWLWVEKIHVLKKERVDYLLGSKKGWNREG